MGCGWATRPGRALYRRGTEPSRPGPTSSGHRALGLQGSGQRRARREGRGPAAAATAPPSQALGEPESGPPGVGAGMREGGPGSAAGTPTPPPIAPRLPHSRGGEPGRAPNLGAAPGSRRGARPALNTRLRPPPPGPGSPGATPEREPEHRAGPRWARETVLRPTAG